MNDKVEIAFRAELLDSIHHDLEKLPTAYLYLLAQMVAAYQQSIHTLPSIEHPAEEHETLLDDQKSPVEPNEVEHVKKVVATQEEDDFDWDGLVEDIFRRRRESNRRLIERFDNEED